MVFKPNVFDFIKMSISSWDYNAILGITSIFPLA